MNHFAQVEDELLVFQLCWHSEPKPLQIRLIHTLYCVSVLFGVNFGHFATVQISLAA